MTESNGLTRETALDRLEEAARLVEQSNYSAAEKLLTETIVSLESDEALESLYQEAVHRRDVVRQQALETRDEVRAAIDEMLLAAPVLDETIVASILDRDAYLAELNGAIDAYVDQWQTKVRQHLDRWANTLDDPESDSDFKRYRDVKYIPRVAEIRRILFADAITAWVHQLWSRADELRRDEKTAPITLMEYYDRARDVAREASASDPMRLEGLARSAEDKRQQQAASNQIFVSALGGEFYRESLQQLRELPDDELVPSQRPVTEAGEVRWVDDGWVTAREAYDILYDAARKWAKSKAKDYLDKAEQHLKAYEPATALKQLADRENIEAFLDSTDRSDFDKLEADAKENQRQMDEAAQQIEEALSFVTSDPLKAWSLYASTRKQFEWSPAVYNARSTIVSELRNRLEAQKEQARSAFTKRDFDQVYEIQRTVQDAYARVDDPRIELLLEEIKAIEADADAYRTQLRRAEDDLAEIKRLAGSDPKRAAQDLISFESSYAEVLSSLAELDAIRSQVRLQGDAQAELKRLQKFLTSPDRYEVQNSISDAEKALRHYPDVSGFADLIDQLKLHRDYLQAERERENGLYEEALRLYEQVMADTSHPDAGDAKSRRDEVKRLIQSSVEIDRQLNEVKDLITDDPVAAFRTLNTIQPITTEQKDRHNQFKERSRSRARSRIEDTFRKLQQQRLLPLEQVERDLRDLEEMGLQDVHSTWSDKLKPQMAAQRARQYLEDDNSHHNVDLLKRAVGEWDKAIEFARQAEQDRRVTEYEAERVQTQRYYAQALLQLVRDDLQRLSGAMTPEIGKQVDHLRDLMMKLRKNNNWDAEVILWQAQLALAAAGKGESPKTWEKHYHEAAEAARSAQKLAGSLHEADSLIQVADTGEALAKSFGQIERHVTSGDVKSMHAAWDMWEQELQTRTAQDPYQHMAEWWNKQCDAVLARLNVLQDVEVRGRFAEIAPALALNPFDARAQAVLRDLGAYKDSLNKDVNSLKQSQFDAEGIEESQPEAKGMQILNQQIEAVEGRQKDVEALRELANVLANHPVVGQTVVAANNEVGERLAIVRDLKKELTDFKSSIEKMNQLLPTEQQGSDFREIRGSLEKWSKYAQHPAYKYIVAEIERRQAERQKLQEKLDQIRIQVESESYESAMQQMNEADSSDLVSYGLADSYTVKPPHEPKPITGWDDVYEFVKSRVGIFSPIIDFIADIDDYSNGPGEITGIKQPTRRVVDWPRIKPQVEQHVHQGQFEEARELLKFVLEDTQFQEWMTLTSAVAHAEVPPVVKPTSENRSEEKTDNPEQRWSLAMKYVGSAKGLQMLEKAKLRREQLRQHLEDAKKMQGYVDVAEREWQNGWMRWQEGIENIAARFDEMGKLQPGPVTRLLRRSLMRKSVEMAYDGYTTCKMYCPDHPVLDEMIGARGLWLYQHAKKLSRFRES